MMTCEACDQTVSLVLRHREYDGAMTHRVTSWLCRDCHPTAPTAENGDEAASSRVVTDGGTTAVCPQCAASTVNVQGVYDCVGCDWNSY